MHRLARLDHGENASSGGLRRMATSSAVCSTGCKRRLGLQERTLHLLYKVPAGLQGEVLRIAVEQAVNSQDIEKGLGRLRELASLSNKMDAEFAEALKSYLVSALTQWSLQWDESDYKAHGHSLLKIQQEGAAGTADRHPGFAEGQSQAAFSGMRTRSSIWPRTFGRPSETGTCTPPRVFFINHRTRNFAMGSMANFSRLVSQKARSASESRF